MTSAGAFNVCPANPVDVPAASAPSSGNSSDSRVFGQQLRDAHESLTSHTDDRASGSTSSPKRAAARLSEKKTSGDGDARVSVPAPISTQPTPALPVPLDFGLNAGIEPGADTNSDGQNSGALATGMADAADAAQVNTQVNIPVNIQADTQFNTQAGTQFNTQAGTQFNTQSDTQFNTQLPAAPDVAAEAPQTGAMPKELTFALKLDPQAEAKGAESAKDNNKAVQEGISPRILAPIKSSAAAVKAVEEARRAETQADTTAPRADALSRIAAFQAAPQNQQSSGPEAAAAARIEPNKALEAAAIQTPAVESPSKAAPLKELSIQVGQTQQDRVELRMVDRAGEVQVAVRSANPDVAHGLRQSLSDLVGRLEQNGFRTEAWRPGATVSSVPGTGESREKEMQFQRDGSQSQSGGSQQGRQQNHQNHGNRPRWVQELEGSISGGDNLNPGDSYGITS